MKNKSNDIFQFPTTTEILDKMISAYEQKDVPGVYDRLEMHKFIFDNIVPSAYTYSLIETCYLELHRLHYLNPKTDRLSIQGIMFYQAPIGFFKGRPFAYKIWKDKTSNYYKIVKTILVAANACAVIYFAYLQTRSIK